MFSQKAKLKNMIAIMLVDLNLWKISDPFLSAETSTGPGVKRKLNVIKIEDSDDSSEDNNDFNDNDSDDDNFPGDDHPG